MKVLGISSSYRKDSNSEWYLRETLKRLEAEGLETELVSLRGKTILPCRGCYGCRDSLSDCTIKGDDFKEFADKMWEADGILLASPVYYGSVVPQLMCLLDRVGFSGRWTNKFLSGKVGAPITVARRAGHNTAFSQLLMWFFINDMIVPGSTYWNVCVAGAGGARNAEEDLEGIQILEHFAHNMAVTMKALDKYEEKLTTQ